ncbi:hypothetical protein CB0940_08468 [Cercospora beticola]|uniref:GPI anchored protein n=1 Tax=Cercospora beticola TaxID=122368 RepID=A0A2G5HQP7_CERBT|nr:hypothetical protein CB0940_08468 [Cercospora beticola]PIA94845.1 hypothetical protein CB0940_08468 [Cercospora beticola]WPB05042.1 hypothetical protein RHO25_009690 [Cercospora beticola]
MVSRSAVAVLAAATTAASQSVRVVVETSHGGASNGLINTTVTVPVNTIYTDSALDAVSTLYLTQAEGVDLSSVTCTPFKNGNATGNAALPFNSTSPSRISTNTEQIGSLVCASLPQGVTTPAPASITHTVSASSAPLYSNTTVTAHNATSVLLTTVHPTVHATPSTFTSIATFSGANGQTTSTYTSVVNVAAPTSSGSPSLNSQGAAPTKGVAGWMAGAAIAGFGLMAAL